MDNNCIVIIGAGPAGLAAAHEFISAGKRPIVLERSDKVGGIARTESYKDYLFDMGGHRFFTKIDRVNRLWHEMLGEDFIKVARMSRIYYQDRFFKYPLSFVNALVNLGPLESFLIPVSYLAAQLRPYQNEDTFEQWVSNRFGRRLYRTFFKTYTEKVWGISCDQIRADWAAQRIKGLSLMAAVANALFKSQNSKTLIDEFEYPLKGPGMMWHRFCDVVEAGGGEIRLNAEAVTLECKSGRVSGVVYRNGEKQEEIPVDQVISSVPITNLVNMIRPDAPPPVLDAARNLSFRAFIIVGLIIEKRELFPDQWIYIHSPQVRVGRIQNFKNWSPAMVPDSAKTNIGMEYFCSEGDDLWNMSDAELVEMAARELNQLGLSDSKDVIDSFVVRQPKAYPVYDQDYKRNLDEIRLFLSTITNIQTVGRNGMHRYNNMDHSMYTGILAAQNTMGAKHNLWEVNEEEEYLEEEKRHKGEGSSKEDIILKTFAKMDKAAFATAVGMVSGIIVFLTTIWLLLQGGEVVGPKLQLLRNYFSGYSVSFTGSLIGFGYSFLWGFLFGWLFAYLRNFFLVFYVYSIKKKLEVKSLKEFLDYI